MAQKMAVLSGCLRFQADRGGTGKLAAGRRQLACVVRSRQLFWDCWLILLV
jgi:hypothetical protein